MALYASLVLEAREKRIEVLVLYRFMIDFEDFGSILGNFWEAMLEFRKFVADFWRFLEVSGQFW